MLDMEMDRPVLDRALETLGATLEARGRHYELVAIGGSALILVGRIGRATKDLDIVALLEDGNLVPADPMPAALVEAGADVGRILGLAEDWLNPGPTELLRFGLPDGFLDRVETRRYGALTLHLAGRFDQICFKVYAAADQGMRSKHAADLRALQPTGEELLAAARWSTTHDPSGGYRQELLTLLAAFGVESADAEL
jgi:hypothetical protein